MSNAEALEAFLASSGLEGEEALIEAARGLAAAVDAHPERAALWREYRAVLSDLRGLVRGASDVWEDLLRGAPLGDPENSVS